MCTGFDYVPTAVSPAQSSNRPTRNRVKQPSSQSRVKHPRPPAYDAPVPSETRGLSGPLPAAAGFCKFGSPPNLQFAPLPAPCRLRMRGHRSCGSHRGTDRPRPRRGPAPRRLIACPFRIRGFTGAAVLPPSGDVRCIHVVFTICSWEAWPPTSIPGSRSTASYSCVLPTVRAASPVSL